MPKKSKKSQQSQDVQHNALPGREPVKSKSKKQASKKRRTKKKSSKKKTSAKRQPGRPSKYSQKFDDIVKDLVANNAGTMLQVAEFFTVHLTTLYDWMDKYPSFAYAVNEGRDIANRKLEEALYECAMGYTETEEKVIVNPKTGKESIEYIKKKVRRNPQVAMWWLQNRDPERWRNKQVIEHTDSLAEELLAAKKRARAHLKDDE